MHILTAKHLTKVHGARVLFEDLEFHMNRGDKAGFIAPNGSGKTTLIRMLTGLEESDDRRASVFIHPEVTMGYLQQMESKNENETILDYIFNAPSPQIRAVKLHKKASEEGDAALLTEAVQLMEKTSRLGHGIENRRNPGSAESEKFRCPDGGSERRTGKAGSARPSADG